MARRPQSSSERRASVRVPYRVRAVLSTRLGEVAADVINLSAGGLGLEIAGELREWEFVRVLFPLATDDEHSETSETSEWIDPDALIARVYGPPRSGRTRVGLSFFELPPDTLRRIAACVVSRLKSPAATAPAARVLPSRPPPAATPPTAASETPTRELRKAASRPLQPSATARPLHIPRTSARELRDLFHEALAALEEDTGRPKNSR